MARRGVSLRALDLTKRREQEPLPETADELCAVAAAVGTVPREADTVWLGERATERKLKALSGDGKLARGRERGDPEGQGRAVARAGADRATAR
jgi:hypothetical protein